MRKLIYTFTCVLFLIGLIIGIIEFRAYDRSFYAKEYTKLATYEYIGISEEDLKETTDVLLSYMEGKRDDMVVYATINNKEREVFNEKEKQHMVDVVKLIRMADLIKYVSYGLMSVVLCVVYVKHDYRNFGKSILYAVGILVLLLAAIGIFVAIDFNLFWTYFHLVFFDNDLWLLNPRTDVMIQMFPEQFFKDVVIQIVLLSVASVAAIAALGFGLSRKKEYVRG